MVDLYAIDIKELPDAKKNPEVLYDISSKRRKKVMEYLHADDRKRCFGAGILLSKVLPLYGESPEKITFEPNGKPKSEKICFNISHSGTLVICAVNERPVGCDIEKIENEPKGIAKRFFHHNEIHYLQTFHNETRNEMFFRLWTLKESYIKMTGEGLHIPLKDFEILLNDEKIQVRRENKILPCHIMEYFIPKYKVSVCAEEEKFAQCIKYVKY